MPPKWELPFSPWLPCNPIDPGPDLIPPAATVPPFCPSHFAPPNFRAPASCICSSLFGITVYCARVYTIYCIRHLGYRCHCYDHKDERSVLRALLDTRAKGLDEKMLVTASYAIASLVEKTHLNENYVIPKVNDQGFSQL